MHGTNQLNQQISMLSLFGLLVGVVLAVGGSRAVLAQRPASQAPDYQAMSVDELTKIVGNEELGYQTRCAAAYALGQRGPAAAPAIDVLVGAMDAKTYDVIWYAIDTLGRIGPDAKPAVPHILTAMEKTQAALDRTEEEDANGNRSLVFAADALGRIGPDAGAAVETLQTAREHKHGPFRVAAAKALWSIQQDNDWREALPKELKSDDVATIFAATVAMTDLPPEPSFIPSLLPLLNHSDQDVRHAALRALVHIGPVAAEPISRELRGARNPQTQAAGLAALRWIATEARRDLFLNLDTTREDYIAAARPLLAYASPLLLEKLSDNSSEVRRRAADALAAHGVMILPGMFKQLETAKSPAQGELLAAIAQVIETLPDADTPLPSPDASVRAQTLKPLMSAIEHESADIRAMALRTFAALQFGAAGAEAAPLLRAARGDSDIRVRRQAVEALRTLQE